MTKLASQVSFFSQVCDAGGEILDLDYEVTHPITLHKLLSEDMSFLTSLLEQCPENAEYLGGDTYSVQNQSTNSGGVSATTKRPLAPKRTFREKLQAKMRSKANREATKQDQHVYAKEFAEAKIAEFKSWAKENSVFEFVDMRKCHVKNFVTGRWVLTIKRDKDGNFLKVKARWVLRGFLDKQQSDLQTDSPTSTRPGF